MRKKLQKMQWLVITLLLGTVGLSKAYAQDNFDFSSECSTGQTLFYRIIDETNHYVALVGPNSGNYPWAGYTQPTGEIVLQSIVHNNGIDYSVIEIADQAFYYCNNFTSIEIPSSVTSIGRTAFAHCSSLSSVIIPNSVTTIGNSAFYECTGLTMVSIPNTLTTIGETVFYRCSSLVSVNIPNTVTSIGREAFSNCSNLVSVTIPSSVTSIGKYAFLYCSSLDAISFPHSLVSIEESAFSDCGFESIFIPSSVVFIGKRAFSSCGNLIKIEVDENNQIYDSRGNCNAIIETESNSLIAGCKNTIVPISVTSLGHSAFRGCRDLTSISIPDSVDSIGDYVFSKCSSLSSIIIPNLVNSIGDHAFSECSSLFSLSIPNTVTSIKDYAFWQSGLVSIDIPSSVTFIGANAFERCPNLISATIPNTITTIKNQTFRKCTSLLSIVIPNSVVSIEYDAFANCDNMNYVVALGTVPPSLGGDAFGSESVIPKLIVSCGCKEAYMESSDWHNYFETIEEDCNLYNIGVVDADGGSISISANQARLGEEVRITPNPNQEFVLLSVTVCNANDETQLVPVWDNKFTMPNFDVIVKPHFSHTSVNEIGAIPVSIYPNPVKDRVTIETESVRHISISNMIGQLVFEGAAEGDSFEYDFSSQEVGVYLIRIETSNGTISKRIIVTK